MYVRKRVLKLNFDMVPNGMDYEVTQCFVSDIDIVIIQEFIHYPCREVAA